jgi:hypothetical protein
MFWKEVEASRGERLRTDFGSIPKVRIWVVQFESGRRLG